MKDYWHNHFVDDIRKMYTNSSKDPSLLKTICHGDYWINNMLFSSLDGDDPNLQIWNEKTQDLVSIPFQCIVETLQEKKEAEQRRAIETVWRNSPAEQMEQGGEQAQNIDDIDNGQFGDKVVTGPSEEEKKAKEVARCIRKIDEAVAKAEETVNNCADRKEFKMLTRQASRSKTEPKPKIKLSNSERCRMFRENR